MVIFGKLEVGQMFYDGDFSQYYVKSADTEAQLISFGEGGEIEYSQQHRSFDPNYFVSDI